MTDIPVILDSNAEELGRQVERALTQALNAINAQANKSFSRLSRQLGQSLGSKDALRGIKDLARGVGNIEKSLAALQRQTDAFGGSFGKNFDPRNVDGLNDALGQLIRRLAEADGADLTPEGLDQYRQDVRALTAAVTAYRETALAAARAVDEANRNTARDQRQASREAIESQRTERSRFVVEQQRQASAARDAARQRVAIIQAAARTIATIERGLSNVFRQTARVFSSAFSAAANTVSGVANGIGRAFTRTTTNIRNSVNNSNSEISRSYRKTFGDTTNTVRNETRSQASVINNFAREASASLSSIGSGARFGVGAAIGGILGVGAARALRGGFERATVLENSERALTKLLSSAEDAKTLLTEVTDVVTGTPFRLDQFSSAATQLLAFNVEAEKIPEVLRTIGDAAALSIDPNQTVDRLVRTFGQIQAAGKLTTEDLNQLTEAGVPAWALLGNQLGKTTVEMRELVTEGAVPAEQAIDLLLNGIQNGTTGVNDATVAFAGLSKELGGTLSGSLANFNTSISRLGANVITAFKEPFTAALGAATAGVDLLSTALKTLAVAVSESGAFRLLQRGLTSLTSGLKGAKTELQPFFDIVADGIVLLGQLALGVGALRRFPVALRLIGVAAARILTPFNLLLSAGVLLAGGFKRLLDQSPSVREAFADLLEPLRRIGQLLSAVGRIVLDEFSNVLDRIVVPATRVLAGVITSVVVPALERLTKFLEDRVLPIISRFTNFVLTKVVPAISKVLVGAVEIAKTAFSDFIQFVKVAGNILVSGDFIGSGGVGWLEEDGIVVRGLLFIRKVFEETVRFAQVAFDIIVRGGTAGGLRTAGGGWLAYNGPIAQGLNNIRNLLGEVVEFFRASARILIRGEEFTEGTGWLSEDGLVIKGLNNIRSVMESVVNFAKSNFIPVLAGVGATAGLFAITGNAPLAGLAGITTGIVAALSDDDIRNALLDTITKAIAAVRERLENLVDEGTLSKIAVNVLKVARRVGQVLGNILTDPRLLALVAGIAAYAAALAGAFALGLVEGVISNIPDIVRGLNKALNEALAEALKAAARNPALGLAAALLFGGALFLRGVAKSGQRAGEVFANSAKGALTKQNFTPSSGGLGSFTGALFGGTAAIEKQVAQEFETVRKMRAREVRRLERITLQATGRGLISSKGLAINPTDIRGATKAFGEMTTQIGSTRAAAATLASGWQDVTEGFRKFGQQRGLIVDGLRSIGEGAKTALAAVGRNLGALAGGAFAASFVSQALFDVNASGRDRLQSGLGTIAIASATGAQIGGAKGAAIGAGVGVFATAIGFLSAAFAENKRTAEEAAAAIGQYADALSNVDLGDGGSRAEQLRGVLRENLLGADDDIRGALRKSGFRLDDLITDSGNVSGLGAISASLAAANVEGETFNRTMDFLRTQVRDISRAGQELDLAGAFEPAVDQASLAAGATEVAAEATQRYRDKVNELNEARLDGFRARVDEARADLDNAGLAADAAKEKLRQFLAGEGIEQTLEQQANNAVIAVDNIANSLSSLDISKLINDDLSQVDTAVLSNKVIEVQTIAAGLLSNIDPTDPVAVETALAPLRTTISESGVDQAIQDQLTGGIEAAVAAAESSTGGFLFAGLFQKEQIEADLEEALAGAEVDLAQALTVDPESIALIAGLAAQEFETVGAESLQGFADGFDGPQAREAATRMGEDALAAAREALGIQSPSTEYKILGRQSVAGYVAGFREALDTYDGALRIYGRRMMESVEEGLNEGQIGMIQAGRAVFNGFIAGMIQRRSAVVSTAASIARSAANAVRGELQVRSPSKVMEELGRETMEGFALGIEQSAASVANAVQTVIDTTTSGVGAFDVNAGVQLSAVDIAAQRATATPGGYAETGGLMAISPTDITTLAKKIAEQTKPNVNIEQTFTEPVDSRAVAADVAWRLT